MSGSTFQVGEQKIRPGVYVRVTNIGESAQAIIPQGTVAALFKASWGPLGTHSILESINAIAETYGVNKETTDTIDTITEAFKGGCSKVVAYRLGTGGTAASLILKDTNTTAANVVTITAKYPGTRGNDFGVILRDSLTDATKRELLLYEGVTLKQTIAFAKGSSGDGEPAALVSAVNASNSSYITASKISDGNKILAAISTVTKLASGANPTVASGDYTTALSKIEAIDWNVLVTDTEDTANHAAIKTYIDRVRNEGKRAIGVVGEKTSIDLATRLTNATSFNDPAIVYVANGFKGSDGAAREGYKSAARVAGMIAAADITDSLTHAIVANATEVVGGLTNAQVEQAIQSGALVFTMNANKQVQVEYGITTFVTPTADMDAGWKKIRRVKTRDNLMARIAGTWDPLIGKINNSPDGRATLIAAAQGIINQMIAEGALLGGTIFEDTNNPPVGDSAWFVVQVDDLDSTEKVYINFQFRFNSV